MGLYYSGMLDWSFEPGAIKDDVSFSENGVKTKEYTEYADNQWYELIDNYEPVILWNDIGYPPHTNLYELFAYFYNKIPEGVVNDRWRQPFVKGKKNGNVSHKDFATPEYKVFKEIMKRKWECTRGIGNSYGYNKFETEKDYMNSAELVRLFVDIVSKNGNLLLNVGPKPDGTIPELQAKCLEGFGKWMEINGEAIYGTRPWSRAEGKTTDNIDVRFTQNQDAFFIILLDRPAGERAEIISLMVKENSVIQLLGHNQPLDWKRVNDNLEISVPDMPDLPDAPAYSFKVTPKP
jgi:alpha-L-fucosidase